MRIAVIGSGIAGNAAAYALHGSAQVTLYERETRFGGHSATVDVGYDGDAISVDTGFIVYNELNYPNLKALFAELDVATKPSRMSFSVSIDQGRLEWCGRGDRPLSGLFAQRRNAVSPAFWMMLKELLRFRATALRDLAQERVNERIDQCIDQRIGNVSLGAYVARHGFSRRFVDTVLVPMGAAIWSTSPRAMLDFPASAFLVFFDNHRLLHRSRPQWRTVRGGSRTYVEKLTRPVRCGARLATPAAAVRSLGKGTEVVDDRGNRDVFDHVIIATHAPQAFALLDRAPDRVRRLLQDFRTAENTAYLHRDVRLMPKRRAAWAAWNVLSAPAAETAPVSLTYWMNLLQNIDERRPLFVTLNPPREPDPALTFGRYCFAHPQFDPAAVAARAQLPSIQGIGGIWFCGAWTGHGFHEDGLVSGLSVAEALGGGVPWRRRPDRLRHEAAE